MKNRLGTAAVALAMLAACLASPAAAGDTERRTFPIPGFGVLTLDVPPSWTGKVRDTDKGLPATIEFSREGEGFSLKVTPTWKGVSRNDLSDPAAVRAVVKRGAETTQGPAAGKSLPIREFRGNGKTGYCYTAADRAPSPEGFRHTTQGIVTAGEYGLIFTVRTREADSRHIEDAIGVLLGAGRSK